MEGLGILWPVIIGIAAGAIAGRIMKGSGFGIIINLIIGLIGVLGAWIYRMLGIGEGSMFGVLLMFVIGAVVLLWIISLLKGFPNAILTKI